jgi:hypothetical protein
MPRHRSSRRPRLAAMVILAVALAVPLASATPAPLLPVSSAPEASAAAGLLSYLSSLWSRLLSLVVDEGCHVDPSGGGCVTSSIRPSPVVAPDAGCHVDPDGRCLSGS